MLTQEASALTAAESDPSFVRVTGGGLLLGFVVNAQHCYCPAAFRRATQEVSVNEKTDNLIIFNQTLTFIL